MLMVWAVLLWGVSAAVSLKVVVLCVRRLLSCTYSCVREGCCHVCICVSEKIQSVTHWVNTVQETKFYSMVRFAVVVLWCCGDVVMCTFSVHGHVDCLLHAHQLFSEWAFWLRGWEGGWPQLWCFRAANILQRLQKQEVSFSLRYGHKKYGK